MIMIDFRISFFIQIFKRGHKSRPLFYFQIHEAASQWLKQFASWK